MPCAYTVDKLIESVVAASSKTDRLKPKLTAHLTFAIYLVVREVWDSLPARIKFRECAVEKLLVRSLSLMFVTATGVQRVIPSTATRVLSLYERTLSATVTNLSVTVDFVLRELGEYSPNPSARFRILLSHVQAFLVI
jgi:hypothetical protein